MYCEEPGCDCRRVFFTVFSQRLRKPLAVIAFGWESADFYARWLNGMPVDPKLLQGPILDPGSAQSKYAPALLDLIENVVLADPAYIDRLKRHYRMVREAVSGKCRSSAAPAPTDRDAVSGQTPRLPTPVLDRKLHAAERKRIWTAKMRKLHERRSQKKRPR